MPNNSYLTTLARITLWAHERRRAMDKNLQDRLRRNLTNAVELRAQTLYRRSESEQAPLNITVCQGPGRCMLPESSEGITCPFCATYPADAGSYAPAHVEAFAKRMIAGN